MARTRVCIVGGGSYTWGPTLLRDVAAMPGVTGEVVLHDLAPEPLAEMARLGRAIMEQAEAPFTVEETTDLADALRGADFVVVAISTGGLAATARDLEVPRRYGVHQAVGDTVGPGGLARALRNVPPMLEIARTMERVCPNAWLLNLTNPMTTLTRAVTKATTITTVGLCHEVAKVRDRLGRLLGAAANEIEAVVAGVNHLVWVLGLTVRGEDALTMLEVARRRELTGDPAAPLAEDAATSFGDRWRIKLAMLDAYGYLPAIGDRHLAEFFPFFLTEAAGWGRAWGVVPTTVAHREANGAAARARVRAWLDGTTPIPLGRSGEEVTDIIAAVATGRSTRAVVNLPNRGQIDNLPRDAVVETTGVVGPTGARGIAVGELPPAILGTVGRHVANQELTVEAALTGDRSLALSALLSDPLVRDFGTAPRMLDDLLRAHAPLLPQF